MANLSIAEASLYVPESTDPSSGELSSDTQVHSASLRLRRDRLNDFLAASDKPVLAAQKKPWKELGSKQKRQYIGTTRDAVVSTLDAISPEDNASLWEALLQSGEVEKSLGLPATVTPADDKYLQNLANTYSNASTWDTKRQVLSIMADLVPFRILQRYLPDITEYRVKAARHHALRYGRGFPVTTTKSPRMRVDRRQLDHFLAFVTSPHVIQDLPFGQKVLTLADGTVLETPNLIRTLIPERIVAQYREYCKEVDFTPFSRSTMLRILDCCSANVRKSLQGLDYLAADGAKAFDDLITILPRLSCDRDWLDRLRRSLKEGKQYIKADYKVS